MLFIGNSFTFAYGSPVQFYRAGSVHDLNDQGIGGVPALFKSFATQSGLPYEVYLETQPGAGIDWHLEHKQQVLMQRPWDIVVMHGYSTLDQRKPGDPATLVASVRQLAALVGAKNPAVDLRLIATWPRADQVYESQGAWFGKSLEVMNQDIRRAYDLAAAGIQPREPRIVPVGEAWLRAMQSGLADVNPYDGIDAGKFDLWTYDHYHASTFGYYLEALMVFGSVTGLDPRSLGPNECSAYELGLSPEQVRGLQQVAAEQLAAEAGRPTAQLPPGRAAGVRRCH